MSVYWRPELDDETADRLVRETLRLEETRTLIAEYEEFPDVYLDAPKVPAYEIASGRIVLK